MNNQFWKGKHRDDITKSKISNSLRGNVPWNKGRTGLQKHTEEWKQKYGFRKGMPVWNKGLTKETDCRVNSYSKKLSECMKGKTVWNKGVPMKDETKNKLSEINKSKKISYKHTDEIKKIIGTASRIRQLKRLEQLGIPSCQDKGAVDFFNELNKKYNTNFKPTTFIEIGYVADGYDKNKHIWIEYDTPYHSRLNQKKKDKIREENIINYFNKKGNPLERFIRVTSKNSGIDKIYL